MSENTVRLTWRQEVKTEVSRQQSTGLIYMYRTMGSKDNK